MYTQRAVSALDIFLLCVFVLKGDGEPTGQSQREPEAADPAGS